MCIMNEVFQIANESHIVTALQVQYMQLFIYSYDDVCCGCGSSESSSCELLVVVAC